MVSDRKVLRDRACGSTTLGSEIVQGAELLQELQPETGMPPSLITSRQEPRSIADEATQAALASDQDKSESLRMVFRCSRARARAKTVRSLPARHRVRYKGCLIVRWAFDLLSENRPHPDNQPGDGSKHPLSRSNLDGQMNTLSGWMSERENNQVHHRRVPEAGMKRELDAGCRDGRQVNSACALDRSRCMEKRKYPVTIL